MPHGSVHARMKKYSWCVEARLSDASMCLSSRETLMPAGALVGLVACERPRGRPAPISSDKHELALADVIFVCGVHWVTWKRDGRGRVPAGTASQILGPAGGILKWHDLSSGFSFRGPLGVKDLYSFPAPKATWSR